MTPVVIGGATLHRGDCIEVMRGMADASVDSIVTDPPYGIRFMGKSWDGADIEARTAKRRSFASHAPDAGPNGGHKSIAAEAGKYELTPKAMRAFQDFSEEWAREAFRVLKPGGHLLSFASTRTYHRMASGIEDAGFEVRDQFGWAFGSGFPKSRNIAKEDMDGQDAEDWAGWGTAVKPAWEPICFARKPIAKGLTVAANVLQHGTGALNIGGCRINTSDELRVGSGGIPCRHDAEVPRGRAGQDSAAARYSDVGGTDFAMSPGPRGGDPLGRWPANIIHDGSDEVVALFPCTSSHDSNDSGGLRSSASETAVNFKRSSMGSLPIGRGDSGNAARFFYCAKASRADRNEGLGSSSTPAVETDATMRECEIADWSTRNGNHHPTVKPTDLMAYLCRLVTPPGGTVLDPFMGSGSTGKAAIREGFKFIGIDMTPEYVDIATARISHEIERVANAATEAQAAAELAARQPDLFAPEPMRQEQAAMFAEG